MNDSSSPFLLLALFLCATLTLTVAAEGPRVFRTPQPPARAQRGDVWISPRDGAPMVFVPAGEFLMGSNDSRSDPDERPVHRVYLDAFWIDKYEVTNERFERFTKATKYVTEDEKADWMNWRTFFEPGQENDPVRWVNFPDIAAYARWAGKQLPTEAQWEKAARGTDGRPYPWGTKWDGSRLNLADCFCVVTKVGTYAAGMSPYGAHDLLGNVREWCRDWYDPHYYSHSPRRNPTGPPSGKARVCRGGAWDMVDGSIGYRVFARQSVRPQGGDDLTGFRCVRPAR
jgi:formylglycine-generating enzyme required for sulfatase activity